MKRSNALPCLLHLLEKMDISALDQRLAPIDFCERICLIRMNDDETPSPRCEVDALQLWPALKFASYREFMDEIEVNAPPKDVRKFLCLFAVEHFRLCQQRETRPEGFKAPGIAFLIGRQGGRHLELLAKDDEGGIFADKRRVFEFYDHIQEMDAGEGSHCGSEEFQSAVNMVMGRIEQQFASQSEKMNTSALDQRLAPVDFCERICLIRTNDNEINPPRCEVDALQLWPALTFASHREFMDEIEANTPCNEVNKFKGLITVEYFRLCQQRKKMSEGFKAPGIAYLIGRQGGRHLELLAKGDEGGVFADKRRVFEFYDHIQEMDAGEGKYCGSGELLSAVKMVMRRIEEATSINELLSRNVAPCVARALAPYQRSGVEFILDRDGRALLADEMGLGKTLQAIAVMSAYMEEDWPLLVLCPSSARYQWKMEFMRWMGVESTTRMTGEAVTGVGRERVWEVDDGDGRGLECHLEGVIAAVSPSAGDAAPSSARPTTLANCATTKGGSSTVLKDGQINVLTTGRDMMLQQDGSTRVVICSITLIVNLVASDRIHPGMFRAIVVDESHVLKNKDAEVSQVLSESCEPFNFDLILPPR